MDRSNTGQKTDNKAPAAGRTRNRIVGVVLVLVFTSTVIFTLSSSIGSITGNAAMLSAKLSVPQGGAEFLDEQIRLIAALLSPPQVLQPALESDLPRQPSSSSLPQVSSSSSPYSSSPSGVIPPNYKAVKTLQYGMQTGNGFENYAGICVDRLTKQFNSADIANQLSIMPDIGINLKNAPQVLIIHTHTTESFSSTDNGSYNPNTPIRDTDKKKNVVRVGDEIAKYLEQNGIGVYHDTGYYDYPEFDGAYARSLAAIKKDMKKYPTIKVVLDIHRDSIQQDDGTRIKPTATINGKKAAQIVIVSGCGEPGSSMTVPDWQWNYRFALRMEQQLNQSFPGLARPVELVDKQYNQQVSHGALFIGFGTEASTLDEVVYSGKLFGQSLAALLKTLQS